MLFGHNPHVLLPELYRLFQVFKWLVEVVFYDFDVCEYAEWRSVYVLR
jgi:hypothetical protein